MTLSKFQFLSRMLFALVFAVPLHAQQSPKIALKIVKHNGVCDGGANHIQPCTRDCDCPDGICTGDLVPTTSISGVAGDRFVIEAYASEWSPSPIPERLRAWQVQFDDGITGSGNGQLNVQTGERCCWDRADFNSSWECLDLHAPCTSIDYGVCDAPLDDRAAGIFVERYRTDYVFYLLPELVATDMSFSILVRSSSTLSSASDASVFLDTDIPKYLVTIVLVASDNACGAFQFEPVRGIGDSVLLQPDGHLILDFVTDELSLEGVTIDLGSCADCNGNGIPDGADLAHRTSRDCNKNDIPDECDIASGTSEDRFPSVWGADGIPDECQKLEGQKK